MTMLRRLGILVAAGAGAYLALLAILGWALEDRVAGQVSASMAAALDAEVTVGSASVSLLAGTIELGDIRMERTHGGHMTLHIEALRANGPALGRMVVDRVPHEVYVRGVRMTLSTAGAMTLPARPEPRPLRARSMRIEDATLAIMPTALLPGLGRVELFVDRAHTGPVALHSALDWLFAMRELDAHGSLGGSRLGLRYAGGHVTASGSLFGSEPITVPFALPAPDPRALELDKLRVLAQELIRALGGHVSRSWLKRKATERIRDLLD